MQVDNTMAYAINTMANHMAGMATQIGIQQQEIDELKQANQMLKAQIKQKEGDVHDVAKPDTDNGQTNEQPTEATLTAK